MFISIYMSQLENLRDRGACGLTSIFKTICKREIWVPTVPKGFKFSADISSFVTQTNFIQPTNENREPNHQGNRLILLDIGPPIPQNCSTTTKINKKQLRSLDKRIRSRVTHIMHVHVHACPCKCDCPTHAHLAQMGSCLFCAMRIMEAIV